MRLTRILFLFRENAADLFPRKVRRRRRGSVVDLAVRPRQGGKGSGKGSSHRRNPVSFGDLQPEGFPEQLKGLSNDVVAFLDCLNEFPGFTDEAVNTSVISLEGDLKVCYRHVP